MRFLIDRCTGRGLADWLRKQGFDVIEAREKTPDPGDRELLRWANEENRILVTIDTDFGHLIFHEEHSHSGLVRLPDTPLAERIKLMSQVLEHYGDELGSGVVVTVKGMRVRISRRG